jgi:hypothetical protein
MRGDTIIPRRNRWGTAARQKQGRTGAEAEKEATEKMHSYLLEKRIARILSIGAGARYCPNLKSDTFQIRTLPTKTVLVLEIPPVDSPQSAVKVAIAAEARQT